MAAPARDRSKIKEDCYDNNNLSTWGMAEGKPMSETRMRIAARYLLLLEIFMSVTMVSWGLSGWKGGGLLWQALAAEHENRDWGYALCLVGAAQLFVSLTEWLFGREWENGKLLVTVRLRFWLAFLSMTVWVYVCYFIVTVDGVQAVLTLYIQAPLAAIFQASVGVGNLKVATMLDPNFKTTRIQQQMMERRQRTLTGDT